MTPKSCQIIITNENCKLIHCKQRVSYRTKGETTGIVYISQTQASFNKDKCLYVLRLQNAVLNFYDNVFL